MTGAHVINFKTGHLSCTFVHLVPFCVCLSLSARSVYTIQTYSGLQKATICQKNPQRTTARDIYFHSLKCGMMKFLHKNTQSKMQDNQAITHLRSLHHCCGMNRYFIPLKRNQWSSSVNILSPTVANTISFKRKPDKKTNPQCHVCPPLPPTPKPKCQTTTILVGSIPREDHNIVPRGCLMPRAIQKETQLSL